MLKCVLQSQQCKNSRQGETKMSTTPTPAAQWHGIPREQINWHPTLVAERCIGCGICATSCGKNVYAFDYDSQPARRCCSASLHGRLHHLRHHLHPRMRIEFPSQGYVRQVIKKNKMITQAKNMLQADPEKYDVKKRAPVAG
ncbi:MAG: 4Fe-4S binding protein [Comamonadaceae bacterium]|nr:4Fe-4S binding protein [Comamonadaceae bacterium]